MRPGLSRSGTRCSPAPWAPRRGRGPDPAQVKFEKHEACAARWVWSSDRDEVRGVETHRPCSLHTACTPLAHSLLLCAA